MSKSYTIIIHDDYLEEIEQDKKFGERLVDDILNDRVRSGHVYIAGATPDNDVQMFAVFNGTAVDFSIVGKVGGADDDWLRNLAKRFGYKVVSQNTKRGRPAKDWQSEAEKVINDVEL